MIRDKRISQSARDLSDRITFYCRPNLFSLCIKTWKKKWEHLMASMRVTQRASMGTALSCAVISCDSLDGSVHAQPGFVIIFLSGAGISYLRNHMWRKKPLQFIQICKKKITLKSVFFFSADISLAVCVCFYLLLCAERDSAHVKFPQCCTANDCTLKTCQL